jgi:hypothetical protein
MKIFKRPQAIVAIVPLMALAASFSLLLLSVRVGATGSNITGTVRNPSNGTVNGAYVYATNPSSSTPLYGPVTTNSSGFYTLNIPLSGTYDIHIDPPSNNGWSSVVNSNVSVTSDQTINATFSSQTNTISGTLTDSSSNPLSGVTVKIFKGSSQYSATTDASGNYSISAPAGYYYFYLSGNMSGISSFTLTQQNTSSLNLLSGNLTLNLTIHTATMTITQYSDGGQQALGSVYARATSGIASLYPGDPGTTISLVNSTGFSGSATGTIKTIVGATYAASGLESSSNTTSVCESIPGTSSFFDCLRLPLTVTGDVSFNVPVTSPATRTYSGVLTDGSGTPISGATVTLIKYGDSTASATTDSNGNFSVSAMPKKYYLKVSANNVDGMTSFTLTQSSSNPTIDLTSASATQNLQVNTATLTVTANDGSGNPNYFTTVNAQTSSGSTTLYTGDPGETPVIYSAGFSTQPNNNVGTIGTIVGASYSAKGLHVTNTNGSICDLDVSPYWNCLTTAYTVSGAGSLNVPF